MKIFDVAVQPFKENSATLARISQDEARALEDAPTIYVLAQSYLDREDEDWTFVDPEDVKRLARAVLESGR